jgi:hypothetical protein
MHSRAAANASHTCTAVLYRYHVTPLALSTQAAVGATAACVTSKL